MLSRQALFCAYTIPSSIAVAGAAILCIILLARWFFRSAALPRITEARIRVDPFHLSSFRWFRGSLAVVNNGRRRCLVTYLRVRDEKLGFQINKVTEKSEMDMTLWIKGRIKSLLPSPVEAGERRNLFLGGIHEVETFDELPECLTLEVSFDCRQEPLRCKLTRNSEVEACALYTFGNAKTRETTTAQTSTVANRRRLCETSDAR